MDEEVYKIKEGNAYVDYFPLSFFLAENGRFYAVMVPLEEPRTPDKELVTNFFRVENIRGKERFHPLDMEEYFYAVAQFRALMDSVDTSDFFIEEEI